MTCLRSGRYLEAEAAQRCAQSSQELGTKQDTLVLPSKMPWLMPSKGDCKLAAGQCRIPRKGFQGGSGQHWMEVGVGTWPHACLQDRSMELRAAMQQTKHSLSMDLSHSLLPAQGNKPTANPTLLWLFAPKSSCGISLC